MPHVERMPWAELRERVARVGQRNATLMALMPAECQSLNNVIQLKDGSAVTLDYVIETLGNIDIDKVHDSFMIGQRFEFTQPILLSDDNIAYECYYNGPQSMTEIEFEDGSIYRFTENHKLLVNRDGNTIWIEVKDLTESDDIVSVNDR